ncbi:MAG: hypothetical protein OEW37_11545, partial [Rhodospirillaceae bacterium]|nr:hypothetical protein [Rhodospirillaceae bacterium]
AHEYRQAQEQFAYAALYIPNNYEVLSGLAAASYYAGDLKVAAEALNKMLALRPDDAGTLKTAAMIKGAIGDFTQALNFAERYEKTPEGEGFRSKRLRSRLAEWNRFHNQDLLHLAQDIDTSDILGDDNTSTGASPDGSDSSDGDWGDDNNSESDSSSGTSANGKNTAPKMAMVDVVIIRSEERLTTNKGVNLLNGLQMTFQSTLLSKTFTNTQALTADNRADKTERVQSFGFSIPSLTYSINIFNDVNDRNEIIARPTITALDGKASEFFSGAVWHVQLNASSGGDADISDIPVGVKLSITPNFLDDDKVQMNVSASRAFVEGRSSEPSFSNFAQVSKTSVSSNVVMEFGKTLVLSGLSEKETNNVKNGVPVLQDIPVVQYLFSNENTLDFNKSVLILITPRKPQFTHADGSPKTDTDADRNAGQPSVRALKQKNGWDFKPSPNLSAVLENLNRGHFFREFRSGDVSVETWDETESLNYKINHVLEFLYF